MLKTEYCENTGQRSGYEDMKVEWM